MTQLDTLIVGGGLAGLRVAHALQEQGQDYYLVETRERVGGRAYTEHWEGADCDLGAAWFWPQVNPQLKQLASELGLAIFPQYQRGGMIFQSATGFIHRQTHSWAQNPQPMRFHGGVKALIQGLTAGLDGQRLGLGQHVHSMELSGGTVKVRLVTRDEQGRILAQRQIRTRRVVLALPPRLISAQIQFNPVLPAPIQSQLQAMDTWMASHAKAVAVYPQPFWRQRRQSGLAISQCGPLAEIHDASPVHAQAGALFGFFAWPAQQRQQHAPELARRVCEQLADLFGPAAAEPSHLFIQDWSQQEATATVLDLQGQPHHPRGGAPLLHHSAWCGHLFFAGSETAGSENAGYLEGALEAAARCVSELLTPQSTCNSSADRRA